MINEFYKNCIHSRKNITRFLNNSFILCCKISMKLILNSRQDNVKEYIIDYRSF